MASSSPTEFPSALLDALRRARRIAVLTGAGTSAESGVPTFRDAQTGLWAQYRPEELATPEAFRRHPRRVWEWYAARRERVLGASPNPGHQALATLEQRVAECTLATQNVDGLHQRAGSQRVFELHGNILRTKCFNENTAVNTWEDTGEVPPRCPRCHAYLRPDVVWFGEPLPCEAFLAAERASCACDVYFSIGTSSLVYPAAGLPYNALQSGAILVEINLLETSLSADATFSIRGRSGDVLPQLLKAVWG